MLVLSGCRLAWRGVAVRRVALQEERELLTLQHLAPGAYDVAFTLVERAPQRAVFDRAGMHPEVRGQGIWWRVAAGMMPLGAVAQMASLLQSPRPCLMTQ